jgi:sarcosine oxidase subunit alpha
MTVAAVLAENGRAVEIVDDAVRLGGGLRALGPLDRTLWQKVDAGFEAGIASGRVQARKSTVAGGVFGDDLLIVGPAGAEVVTADDVVFATGAHDGAALFEGNDLPGVMSARAAGLLLAEGVVVGRRVVVSEGEKDGSVFGQAFANASAGLCEVIQVSDVACVRGGSKVRAVVVREGASEREIGAAALLTDGPRAPAYELCLQAGARVEHEPRGFVVHTDDGRIRDHFWAVGEVVGTPFVAEAILADGERVARAILGA